MTMGLRRNCWQALEIAMERSSVLLVQTLGATLEAFVLFTHLHLHSEVSGIRRFNILGIWV
jgi:hypothetical protein